MKNQLQQIGCLRIPLYLPLKPFHQKTHACCFSLSGVITHIRQELMSALSKRVFVRASDLSYLSKKNLRLTEQSYFLVVKSYPCYAFFDNVANHVFYLFFWKTIFCINPTKFIKKWKRKKKDEIADFKEQKRGGGSILMVVAVFRLPIYQSPWKEKYLYKDIEEMSKF